MKQPVLVILAAGMGSRYGGLKQIDAVGDHGECIIDFSIYDAWRAGFRKVVLIIRKEHEKAFDEALGNKVRRKMEVEYAYQDLADVPSWFSPAEGRTKPWGTTQALLAARSHVDGPFMIINADDFYGRDSYAKMYAYLSGLQGDDYCMLGYQLSHTLTENGTVTRGVCRVRDGYLEKIEEIKEIRPKGSASEYRDGERWIELPEDTLCSMNYWGFTPAVFPLMEERFAEFLRTKAGSDPMKSEHVIPTAVGELLEEKRIRIRVLSTDFRWFGVTYRADKPMVVERIARYKQDGTYPADLWE